MAKLRLYFFRFEMLDHAIVSSLAPFLSYHRIAERRKDFRMLRESNLGGRQTQGDALYVASQVNSSVGFLSLRPSGLRLL